MVSELSILIPVYNFDIVPLVNELLRQCQRAAVRFEIICLDDASDLHFQENNRKLKDLENVAYEELSTNISRASIRNNLAQRARFSFLLFLDNDSGIIASDFIIKYLRAADQSKILIGGTVYSDVQPSHPYRLHWKYGRNREQKPANLRNQYPYRSLQVNNALVPRSVFLQFSFDEKIIHYGHEDSQWGKRLEQANVPIVHIQNPVQHMGIEPNHLFLIKTKLAIQNLHYLYFTEEIGKDTLLIKSFLWLSRIRLTTLYLQFFQIVKHLLLLNIRSSWPSLFCLDLYKLGLFIQEDFTFKNGQPHAG